MPAGRPYTGICMTASILRYELPWRRGMSNLPEGLRSGSDGIPFDQAADLFGVMGYLTQLGHLPVRASTMHNQFGHGR